MKYCVETIPTNPNDNCMSYKSYHKNYYGALKKHVKITYNVLTSDQIDSGDYFTHFKIFLKSLIGLETNWNDVSLAGENCGTKITKIN